MKRVLITVLVIWSLTGGVRAAEPRFGLRLSGEKVYAGEPIVATLTLRYEAAHPVERYDFRGVKAPGFGIEKLEESGEIAEGDEKLRRFIFLLTPRRAGEATIPPQSIEVAIQDPESYRIVSRTLRTKEKRVEVLPLPAGVNLVGDYRMELQSDRNASRADEPLGLTLRITGEGDVKQIPPFELKIPGAMVYRTPPQIRFEKTKGEYLGRFTQHFTVIAREDFTVPPLSLKLLNPSTGVVEILRTAPIPIRVENPAARRERIALLLALLSAFALGVVTTLLWLRLRRRRRSLETPIARRILRASDDRELYGLLLPYSDDPRLAPFLQGLEEKLCSGGGESLDRREIVEIVERIRQRSKGKRREV
ncbi:hypothetical protein [Nitratifractor sp.]